MIETFVILFCMAFLVFCGWLLRKFNEADEAYEELKRQHEDNQTVFFRDDMDLRFGKSNHN